MALVAKAFLLALAERLAQRMAALNGFAASAAASRCSWLFALAMCAIGRN